ncbi:substrate-binding domain-containing protein [Actinomadura vinacea]|uniref:Substrate-binding domain-containing protein n=1 Tax=Actinomadura vinacea TaxID=115336 RepID=A0ABN3J112_9ACTN
MGAAMLTLGGVMAAPANAVEPSDGITQTLALGGSDTTEDVMGALAAAYNNNATYNPTPGKDNAVNVPVQAEAGSPGFTAAADANCTQRTYVNKDEANPPTTYPAPNGSTDGKNALRGVAPFPTDNLTTGCFDAARSSSGPSSSDPAQFEYYAFGLDAVSWARFPGNAPVSLSIQEIRDIYSCTKTNWNQVGGSAGTIIRYIPQAGSGTRSFFLGTILNNVPPSTNCGPVKEVQEHDGAAVPAADRSNAIVPFSVAQWVAQGNGVVDDKRGGIVIGRQETTTGVLNPVSGTAGDFTPNANVVREPSTFLGVRRVYNVVDTRLPKVGQTVRFVGEDAAGPGYICDPASGAASIITRFGFGLLPEDPGTGSTCRIQ